MDDGGPQRAREEDRRALFEALFRDRYDLDERHESAAASLPYPRMLRDPRAATPERLEELAGRIDESDRDGDDPDGPDEGGTLPLVPEERPIIDRCPGLPPLSGLFSRLRPGRDETVNPYVTPFGTLRDNLDEIDGARSWVQGTAAAGNLDLRAEAKDTPSLVVADLGYAFRLMPRFIAPGNDRVVRAHLFGIWKHRWERGVGAPRLPYTWRLSVGLDLSAWIDADRRYETLDTSAYVLSDAFERSKNRGVATGHDPGLLFERVCEVSASAVHQHLLARVWIHMEVGAPEPGIAYSQLDCEMGICAVDVGLAPTELRRPAPAGRRLEPGFIPRS